MKACKRDIYDPEDKKENKIYRYVLGKKGDNMIICIALNPSSATKDKTDRTFTRICNILRNQNKQYDGLVLLNLCPKISKKPKKVKFKKNIAKINKEKIFYYLNQYPNAKIWCAWGANMKEQKFKKYFKEIVDMIKGRTWCYTSLTKQGHPRHPLSVPCTAELKDFTQLEKESYIKEQLCAIIE